MELNPFRYFKDKQVADRLIDEHFHVLALEEYRSGARRAGLMAKALARSGGNPGALEAEYMALLVVAIRDDFYIAKRLQDAAQAAADQANRERIVSEQSARENLQRQRAQEKRQRDAASKAAEAERQTQLAETRARAKGLDAPESKNWVFLTLIAFAAILGIGLYNANKSNGAFYRGWQEKTQQDAGQPVIAFNQPGSPQSAPAAQAPAAVQAPSLPKKKTEYDFLVDAYVIMHDELNPASPKFNQRLVDQINSRTDALILAGWKNTEALSQAVGEFMPTVHTQQQRSKADVQRQPPVQRASSTSSCVFKTVMDDDDYKACGLTPPR
ncbi:hypothetical protein HNP46_005817 [Pseudomonas nitritireducens]|uniref:Uncharacterized protein n=1 Tax=Pseudomonas nitroreducens TaxID=46680 RepID=A0A7W7KQW8_PSENT|nr:hypothetical protein [Pseudomonas nitritireducens]MBB4866910.1 hypothetical protein [Pseudomonas nitritireducens]